jgi:hypothetical protein
MYDWGKIFNRKISIVMVFKNIEFMNGGYFKKSQPYVCTQNYRKRPPGYGSKA